jgi:hypothetical protein
MNGTCGNKWIIPLLHKLYRARDGFVNCLTVSIKLRKEFKIDNPVQAERSSGYTVQVPSELRRSSIPCELDAKELLKLALDSSPSGVVERCMLYPELHKTVPCEVRTLARIGS